MQNIRNISRRGPFHKWHVPVRFNRCRFCFRVVDKRETFKFYKAIDMAEIDMINLSDKVFCKQRKVSNDGVNVLRENPSISMNTETCHTRTHEKRV